MSALKPSPFRSWLIELWYNNREERLTFKEPPINLDEYFNKYKWWLRREYRFRQKNLIKKVRA